MRNVFLSALGLACALASIAWAGPNDRGTLVVHDAHLLLSGTDGSHSICGQGSIPPRCAEIDTRLDGAGDLGGDAAIFKVYAAFCPTPPARLTGVSWGINYDNSNIVLVPIGNCGDFELPVAGWPAPATSNTVVWTGVQTGLLIPVYWFAAYTYGQPGTFDLGPDPEWGGAFWDDAQNIDHIAGFGKLGFDMPGSLVCPFCSDTTDCCQDSLRNHVANGGFTEGLVYGSMPAGHVDDWSALSATPQVVPDSCSTPGSIWMWGNQVVGEAIKQELPGLGLLAGHTYRARMCYRFAQMSPERPPYVRFRLSASDTEPFSYPPTASYPLIGTTIDYSSDTWGWYCFPDWTAPADMHWIMINPENDYSLNDGAYVSSGRIDNICIQEACDGVANGDFSEELAYGHWPTGHAAHWTCLTGTPQTVPSSCPDSVLSAGASQMWGNLLVGESIMQQLPEAGFVNGKTYRVSLCYRWQNINPERPNHVRFRLTASDTPPTVYPPLSPTYRVIGITTDTYSTAWQTVILPDWHCGNSASWIMVNPENEYSFDDGNYVSWGQIDNICIEEIPETNGIPVDPPIVLAPTVQNRPNPFGTATTIHFDLARSERVSLHIFDVSGRQVRNLLNADALEPGGHDLIWDGRSDSGTLLEGGVYFYQLDVGRVRQARRMILAR